MSHGKNGGQTHHAKIEKKKKSFENEAQFK